MVDSWKILRSIQQNVMVDPEKLNFRVDPEKISWSNQKEIRGRFR